MSAAAITIAIVAHNAVRGDGQGRLNYELARAAARADMDVHLIAQRADADLVRTPGITWSRVRPRLRRPGLVDVWRFARLADRAVTALRRGGGIDVVIANGFVMTLPHDLNLCQYVHAAWLGCAAGLSGQSQLSKLNQRLYTRFNARWERQVYAAAHRVVAPSQLVCQELRSIGVPSDKLRKIPNGVDLQEFRPGAESRQQLGLPPQVPLALFAGDIRLGRKNLDTVLAALALAPEWHLVVIGDERRSPYPAMARRLGVARRVHFLGFRGDVAGVMRACDLFVFPSRYEPFGLVVAEAMATELPVITARTTGAAEIMTPECGVVLDDPHDTAAIAKALQWYQADPELRRQAGRAGRIAAEPCSWERVTARYLELIRSIACPEAN